MKRHKKLILLAKTLALLVASTLLSVPLWATAATLTLPKTGQTLCYGAHGLIDCTNSGQDGETQIGAAWPVPRFTDNSNGTVTDHLTGLIWLQDALCPALNPPPANGAPQGGRNWTGALTAANTLQSGQCGLSDGSVAGTWRLPNVNEMESLVDLSQANPPLPANNHFLRFPLDYPIYWTSTITGDYFPGINAIGEDMFTGKIQGDDKAVAKYIWPVKGDSTTLASTGQNTCWDPSDTSAGGTVVPCNGSGSDGDLRKGVPLPPQRFINHGNGTLTDKLTGLIWPSDAACFGNISSQGQAINAARAFASGTCNLTDGSLPGDWRLPNRKELRSLVDYGVPWLSSPEFSGAPPHGWYWSSDSYAVLPDTFQKWVVKSQGLDWLSSELLTYLQFPPYYMIPVRGALKIQRITFNAPATINFGDPALDLRTVTTGGGSGNPVTFVLVSGPATLSGTTLTFTGGGNVVVQGAQAGDSEYYPAPDTLHTFTVTSLSGSVAINRADLARTYDGTPKPVTATTNPSGMPVTFSYAGSPTPPTNAGSYLVVATVTGSNSQTSSDSATLVVAQASSTPTLGGLSQTYDGSAKTVTATTSPAGAHVTLSYAGSAAPPTDAGSYPVLATVSDPNYLVKTATGNLVIAKAEVSVTLGDLSRVYNGTVQGASATTFPAGKKVTLSYTPANPVNAGSYQVVGTVDETNYSGSASGTFTVLKRTPTINWNTPAPIVPGTPLGATQLNAAGSVPGSFAYTPASGAVPSAGVQTLTAVFTPSDTTNYTGASASVLLTVTAATIFTITFDPGNGSLIGQASQSVASGGSTSPVSALPPAGFHFVQWSGPGGFTSTSNPLTLANVTSNETLSASYAVDSFAVSCNAPGGNGSISCTSPVNYGANSVCTLVPANGFHLFALTDNGADQQPAVAGGSFTIKGVSANHQLTATFGRPDGIISPAVGKTLPDVTDALAVLQMVQKGGTITPADLARADIAPLDPDGKPLGNSKLDFYDVIGILRLAIGLGL
jgi:hypothetical protein